jgi:hypothetical protein
MDSSASACCSCIVTAATVTITTPSNASAATNTIIASETAASSCELDMSMIKPHEKLRILEDSTVVEQNIGQTGGYGICIAAEFVLQPQKTHSI